MLTIKHSREVYVLFLTDTSRDDIIRRRLILIELWRVKSASIEIVKNTKRYVDYPVLIEKLDDLKGENNFNKVTAV